MRTIKESDGEMTVDKMVNFFGDAVEISGYIWFWDSNINALFKMNVRTFRPEFVLTLENGERKKNLYSILLKFQSSIIVCPFKANRIVIYDTISGNLRYVILGSDRYGAKIYNGCVIGHMAYLLRKGYSEVYRLNVFSGELTKIDIVSRERILKASECFWYEKVYQYKDNAEILLYNRIDHILYLYNVDTLKIEKLACFEADQEIADYVFDGINIWILFKDGEIYQLDGYRIIKKYKFVKDGIENFVLFYCRNAVYVIDTCSGQVVTILEENAVNDKKNRIPINNSGISHLSVKDIQWNDGYYYYYDEQNEILGLPESNLADIPVKLFFPDEICEENIEFDLQKLMIIIKYQPEILVNTFEGKIGTKVYNFL